MDFNTLKQLADHQLFHQTVIPTQLHDFRLFENYLLNHVIDLKVAGTSYLNKSIYKVSIGTGPIKILMWSQMHGNESTATAALLDFIFYLQAESDMAAFIKSRLSIVIIPCVNPDGMQLYTRENAQKIDVNRDYLALQSPEARLLKSIFEQEKPNFAFNLHDQSDLYVTSSGEHVGLSFLAPPTDAKLATNWNREQAMKLIAVLYHQLSGQISGAIARFNDEYEPRAFGDNFQKTCPTILIESGKISNDSNKAQIRAFNFYSYLLLCDSIIHQSFAEIDILNYLMIPQQSQDCYHLIIRGVQNSIKTFTFDVGLNYQLKFNEYHQLIKIYFVVFVGDLSTKNAFEDIKPQEFSILGELKIAEPAHIDLIDSEDCQYLSFKAGVRV